MTAVRRARDGQGFSPFNPAAMFLQMHDEADRL